MSSLPKPYYTPQQYLERERDAPFKSEYLSGQIYEMAGASEQHNTISVNTSSALRQQVRGRPCRVYANDMRVQVSPTGLYTYPDVIVVCGDRRFDDEQRDTLINPTVLIEVLSPKTEAYDRGEKFAHFQRLDSLRDYILVAQNRPRVEYFVRHGDQQWLLTVADSLEDTVEVASVHCSLGLSEIYENVEFPPRIEIVPAEEAD